MSVADGRKLLSRRHFGITLLIAAGLQFVIVLVMANHRLAGAGLLTLLTAILAAMAVGGEAIENSTLNPRSLAALLGVLVVALVLGWRVLGGNSSEASARFNTGAAPSQTKRPEPSETGEVQVPGGYAGVILWPEVKPVTMLVAPLPAAALGLGTPAQPLSIPFAGEYWMFQRSLLRPPPNSYMRRGTPAELFFKTANHSPLHMEARQKLERAIDITCCGQMHVMISNADPLPGTISIQVILAESARLITVNLGTVPVNSRPATDVDPAAPVAEVLRFSFPSTPALQRFDEVRIIFHRALGRMDRSARVAIERFVLLPRGASI